MEGAYVIVFPDIQGSLLTLNSRRSWMKVIRASILTYGSFAASAFPHLKWPLLALSPITVARLCPNFTSFLTAYADYKDRKMLDVAP